MIGTKITSAWPIASMTIRVYCKCGAALQLTMNEPKGFEFVMETFLVEHTGEGHEPCDAKVARKKRAKIERQERKGSNGSGP